MSDKGNSLTDNKNSDQACSGGHANPQNFLVETNELNSIKKVIGVVSGKGGVGKSFVTSMLSVLINKKGYSTGILDADITGPSIPKMFGITEKAQKSEWGIFPQKTPGGISIMSINLLLEQDDAPVIWRGPLLTRIVKQFWTDVIWRDLDFLFVDMPPGTGDVPLTVFQSLPLDGIIIVTSPQEVVSLIVKKSFNMARQMNVPVLGVIENMSYVECPDCGKKIELFGESRLMKTAEDLGLDILGSLPIDPAMAQLADSGNFEQLQGNHLSGAVNKIEKLLTKK
ncbi:MAG: P-loop NTPase [Bacillota bacterium]|jgi:Mrp family chromosome partitioning ATPase